MSLHNDERSLTSIFRALGLREGEPAFEDSKTERWEIHKYQKWTVTVLAKNSGDMSQCNRVERDIYLLGFQAEGRQPPCKAEDRTSTSRKLDSHSFGQQHYFADMETHIFGGDRSSRWGWEIQSQKTRLLHFMPLTLTTFWWYVTTLRDVRITFFGGPRAKGREAYFLRFQGRGGDSAPALKASTWLILQMPVSL